MSDDSIEGLARKLADAVPEGLRSVREELEQNFRTVLSTGLQKLDLVTREEFAVQQAVLARTREKLDAMEARLAALAEAPAKKAKPRAAAKTAGKKAAAKKTTKKAAKKARKKT